MTLNGHVKQAIFFGMSKESERLSDLTNLKSNLEQKTGLLFSDCFSNRKQAQKLLHLTHQWVNKNYSDISRQYAENALPHHELGKLEVEIGKDKIVSVLSGTTNAYILAKVFGKQTYISALNKLHPLGLTDEFFAKGDKISDRDFSFLLEET